jgi:hypothetical protein
VSDTWVTETDWLASENPYHLLHVLEERGVKSNRKLRLAAVACARRVWDLLPERVRHAIEVSERYADGRAKYAEMRAAAALCGGRWRPGTFAAVARALAHRQAAVGAIDALYGLLACAWGGPALTSRFGGVSDEECRTFCRIVRDVFGNPFRPAGFDRAWRTRDVDALARAAYEERVLPQGTLHGERLGLLADALEESGCDNVEILAHLRAPGPHVRGCWALDLILGKE